MPAELLFTREVLTRLTGEPWATSFDTLRAAKVALRMTAAPCGLCGKRAVVAELPDSTFQMIVGSEAFRREASRLKEQLGFQTLVVLTAAGRVIY